MEPGLRPVLYFRDVSCVVYADARISISMLQVRAKCTIIAQPPFRR